MSLKQVQSLLPPLPAVFRGRPAGRGPRPAPGGGATTAIEHLIGLAERLVGERSEATSVALSEEILRSYRALDPAERAVFLAGIAARFGSDLVALQEAAGAFLANPDQEGAARLLTAAEPRRQELLRALNHAPGGTHALVRMREDLMQAAAGDSALAAFDDDFVHLFASWFNRGFLTLRRIDWRTPATILERIIRYEAVHAIGDWAELRRRLDPPDRRLYAFFHPALDDEPLIFVEVALTTTVPSAIGPLLAKDRPVLPANEATTAVFYSISNAQRGLRGVPFGNFLIKQVVEDLRRELPRLGTFVTLSPVPGIAAWLQRLRDDPDAAVVSPRTRRHLRLLDRPGWMRKTVARDLVAQALRPLVAHYVLNARTGDGQVIDPVARFHLGNGAHLERINMLGDQSARGLRQSHGVMVNYVYDLAGIARNQAAFARRGEVAASSEIRKAARSLAPGRTPSILRSIRP